MKRVLVLVAASLALIPFVTSAAFARVPELNIQALCKTRSADAKRTQSTTGQSTADCEHDEEAAKQQLNTIWTSTSTATRNQCQSEGRSLGTTSYLDLVTCIQMTDEIKSDMKKKSSSE